VCHSFSHLLQDAGPLADRQSAISFHHSDFFLSLICLSYLGACPENQSPAIRSGALDGHLRAGGLESARPWLNLSNRFSFRSAFVSADVAMVLSWPGALLPLLTALLP
jgi:hypothetical protein